MITWREKMSIDDDGVIDQDHKHLIEIINRFEKVAADGLDRDEAAEILYALRFYTQTHFGREEQLQNLISFPYADAHHQEHADLIKKLDTAIEHLKQSNQEQQDTIHHELSEMLHHWLVEHILHSDLKMRKYVDVMMRHTPKFGALRDLEVDVN
jgi:hemerythrin